MEIKHVNRKKLRELVAMKGLGYYLTSTKKDELVGRRGDYTDGFIRYHLTRDGKCVLSDCVVKF